MFLNFIKKSFLSILSLFVLLSSAMIVKSADSDVAGIIISPPITEKEVQPGSEHNGIIKVTNPNTTTNLKISVSISDFRANGEEGDQTFIELN